MDKKQLKGLIDAAMGREKCDFVIRNASYLDVYNLKWRMGDISIAQGHIVGTEPGLKARRYVDGTGKFLVPGFIDAHVHVESSLMVPHIFENEVLARGTTTAICDPHELTNVLGVGALSYFLDSAEKLKMDLRVMLSSCVPATKLETNGGGNVEALDLVPFKKHPRVLGLAEMMNVPGVLSAESGILEKLSAFDDCRRDGHAPMLRGRELDAYLVAGISSCHETTSAAEAEEKIRKGMSVWIREGSVAKDLDLLIPAVTDQNSSCFGFCTDDRNPLDIANEGHLDFLIRRAIAKGTRPELAYRLASWSVAKHYGLNKKGAIAPGYEADLCLLADAKHVAVEQVWCQGSLFEKGNLSDKIPPPIHASVRATPPQEHELLGPEGMVNIIQVVEGSLITPWVVGKSGAKGTARLSVLERYGSGLPPANGYVRGFGEHFKGAMGTSIGHDSHNLIVVGSSVKSMAMVFRRLIDMQGGIVVASDDKILESLKLPVGGLMSDSGASELKKSLLALRQCSVALGCSLNEPFLQLAFLSLPVIGELKLTNIGLVDVAKAEIIPVSAHSQRRSQVA